MWPEVPLDQLGHVSRGKSRHRPRNDSILYGGPYPFIQTAEVKAADLRITAHNQTYSEAGLAQSRLWPKDTLCITIAANIADTALLSYPACFPDSIIGFIADEQKCDVRFVKYFFNTVQERMKMVSQGATQDNLSQDKLLRFSIPCPPVEVQREIGDILSTYGDLIENNRRRIALLEESARLLYREWFVKFRFPGHEHVKAVDGLSEGWEQWSIEKFGRVETGKTPSTSNAQFFGGDVPFIKTPDMHGNMIVIITGQRLTESGSNSQKNKLLPKDTVIVSCIGTVGVVALTSQPSHTNQQINAVIPHEKFFRAYLYFSISTLKEYMLGMGGGSTMANISKSKFSSIEISKPPNRLLIEFEETVASNISQIESLLKANLLLAEARDALLPKLMSGQLAV